MYRFSSKGQRQNPERAEIRARRSLIRAGEDFLRLGDAGEDVAAERARRGRDMGRELGRHEQPMVEALGQRLEPRRAVDGGGG